MTANEYFLGTDLLGADDIGVPAVIDDPNWGVPAVIDHPNWGVPFNVHDVLGIEHQFMHVLGLIDIKARQDELNQLKQPTIGIARVLLKYGQQVINDAISRAELPDPDAAMLLHPSRNTLPGPTKRQGVKDHLQWHANELAKYTDPNAFYPNANDLKQYVMMSYEESNAVDVGNAQLDVIWGQMWAEIVDALARLPGDLAKKVSDITPSWVKWAIVGGVSAAALLGGAVLYLAIKR